MNTRPQKKEKTCWVITDGRRGIENQSLGIAEALKKEIPLRIEIKRVRLRFPFNILPGECFPPLLVGKNPLALFARRRDHVDPPWPDIIIATGRTSIPYSIAIKKVNNGHTFTIQTQSPRVHVSLFDLVVPPRHDLLTGPNVEPIQGSPNRITDEYLNQGKKEFTTRIAHLPRPLVAVLIGGKSKHHSMSRAWTDEFSSQLLAMARRYDSGLMVTVSRRTGDKNLALLQKKLKGPNIFFWDGRGENPYAGILAMADYIIVTSDSTNMITEAAATGKPVYLAEMPGGSTKFRRFYKDMNEYGATRFFEGTLASWRYTPLRETERIAKIVRNRLENSEFSHNQ